MFIARRPRGGGRRGGRLAAALLLTLIASAALASPIAQASASPSPTKSPAAPNTSDQGTATFGIGPSNGLKLDGRPFFNFLSSPGGQLSDNVMVANISSQPLELRVYPADAVSGADGAIGYAPASKTAVDAGSWLALGSGLGDLGTVTVPAQTSVNVPFTLKVPTGASPGDHIAAIMVALTSKIQNGKNSVNFEQRVASRVDIRVSGAVVAHLAIDQMHASFAPSFVVNPFGTGTATVSYRVRNTGNVLLGGKQTVEISGWYGGTKRASALGDIPPMLPGGSTVITTKIHGVKPGFHLSATATVSPVPPPNAADPVLAKASASTSLWAVPWLTLIVVVALAGGIGWLLWRRSHRPKPTPRRHASGGRSPTSLVRVPVSHSR